MVTILQMSFGLGEVLTLSICALGGGNIRPKGKKSLFISYYETSKGYMFIIDQYNGCVTKVEPRDTTFLNNFFSKKVEIGSNRSLYGVKDEVEPTPIHLSKR